MMVRDSRGCSMLKKKRCHHAFSKQKLNIRSNSVGSANSRVNFDVACVNDVAN